MSEYFKQKLFEALSALVCDGEIDKRLSHASNSLHHLQNKDVPSEYLEHVRILKAKLTKAPFSSEYGYLPQQLSTSEANNLGREILMLFTTVMGGL